MKCVGPTISSGDIERIRDAMQFVPILEDAAQHFTLAGNSTRLKMLFLLEELKELCVCDLAEMLGVSVSAMSQHLAKLRAYGLVATRREAQTIFYRLTEHPFIAELQRVILTKASLELAATEHTSEAGAEQRAKRRQRRSSA